MQARQVQGQRLHGHAQLGFLTGARRQPRTPIDHMTPVIPTRVLHHHQDLAETPQRRQRLHRLHGQRRDPEHHHTRRQTRRPSQSRTVFECLHELGMHRRSRGLGLTHAHVVLQRTPQMRLPSLLIRQGGGGQSAGGSGVSLQHITALRPVGQPIGPVALVAVQYVGHLLRQLVQLSAVIVSGQVMRQRLVHRILRGHLGQQAQQAPDQSRLVERHVHGHRLRPQHDAVHLP